MILILIIDWNLQCLHPEDPLIRVVQVHGALTRKEEEGERSGLNIFKWKFI